MAEHTSSAPTPERLLEEMAAWCLRAGARAACSVSRVLRRLDSGAAWVRALAGAVHLSLRSAAPAPVEAVARLARRSGKTGRTLATLAAVAFPLAVAAVRMGTIAVDRGRYLYYPPRWDSVSRAAAPEAPAEPAPAEEGFGVGGIADPILPLRIMTYTAKQGDTLSGIASAFGLELDTVSSLNRTWGAGVHSVYIGERIRIPNQNGLYLTLTEKKSLEGLCKENDVLAESVLAANGIGAADAVAGSTLFFPGVQHRGVEAAIVAGTAFFQPVAGWISSGYGGRRDPFVAGAWKPHYGIDIVAPPGTPVRAAGSGVVWLTGEDDTFGRQVLIGHQFGFSTFYAHLDRYVVCRGQEVTPQSIIGYVGATGRVTGPHLHFELRSGGAPIDPSARMAPRF